MDYMNKEEVEKLAHFAPSEQLVDILAQRTGNSDRMFFRIMVAYYFTKAASMMRVTTLTKWRGIIPCNMYAVNLAQSGHGKGLSQNTMEDEVLNQFRERFLDETFIQLAEVNLQRIAARRAGKYGTDLDDEVVKVRHEFDSIGHLLFSFDSATVAAVKQMRQKLMLAEAGSMNLEIDEIGLNLINNTDVLTAFLELFDVGKIKQKLVKNTAENIRGEDLSGRTPANMLLFGTPTKLFDGGKTETDTISFLDTGYGRRCFFGFSKSEYVPPAYTAAELFAMQNTSNADAVLQQFSDHFGQLADVTNFGRTMTMDDAVEIELIEYSMQCDKLSASLPEHESIRAAEIKHRFFKVLKLSGVFAFVSGKATISMENLHAAIKLAEESGECLRQMLHRERPYEKLAKYIANSKTDLTLVDLVEDLPFFKGPQGAKNEMLNMATAWGYKNNIIIKRKFNNSIEFFSGESLKETDLDEIVVAYSTDWVQGYEGKKIPFDQLHVLTQAQGHHWVNHFLKDGYRKEENALTGFNLLVLDIDHGVTLKQACKLMSDYKFHVYTTKRHTAQANRFRMVFPLSHTLKMQAPEYKQFIANIFEWLPFEVDAQTNQRARKWASFDGTNVADAECFYNEGIQLIDALDFIPATQKSEKKKAQIQDQAALSNLERWFINNTGDGNRSNQYIRYALMLVDSGWDVAQIQMAVLSLNGKLADPMDEAEIVSTIMVTTAKAIAKRDGSN